MDANHGKGDKMGKSQWRCGYPIRPLSRSPAPSTSAEPHLPSSMLPLFLLPPTSSSKLSAQPQKVTLCCSTPYYASYQRIPHLFTNQAIAVNRSCKSDLPGHLPCSSRGSGWNSQPHSPHLSPPALATSRTAILCLIDRHSFIPQGPLEGECGSS